MAAPTPRQEAEPIDDGATTRAPTTTKPLHWKQVRRAEQQAAYLPEILARLSAGETLTAICSVALLVEDGWVKTIAREPDTFPDRDTVYDWCDDQEIARRFARARALGDEALDDQCLAIADDASQDWVVTPFGKMVDREHIARSTLRIHTRQQIIRRRNNLRPGQAAAAKGTPKRLPPRIDVVGIEPKRVEAPAPGQPINGHAVRVRTDGDDDDGE